MRCPTPCFLCGELAELSDMKFHTDYCDCSPNETCSHGLCVDCNSYWNEEDDDN